jgi:serine protease
VRHFYAAGDSEAAQLPPQDWGLDGVEGYLYPPTISQPPGTVMVLRRYNPNTWAVAVFPVTESAVWYERGFTSCILNMQIGYAVLN